MCIRFVDATSEYRYAMLVQQQSNFASNLVEIASRDEHSLVRQTLTAPCQVVALD